MIAVRYYIYVHKTLDKYNNICICMQAHFLEVLCLYLLKNIHVYNN